VKLTQLSWPTLWAPLFSLAELLTREELHQEAFVPKLSSRLLNLINLLLALGDAIFPQGVFEEFGYELVRVHRTIERFYKVSQRASSAAAQPSLVRSVIAQALSQLAALPEGAVAKLTPAEALQIVRKLQLSVTTAERGALERSAPLSSYHAQASFVQGLMRLVLVRSRCDGSMAPIHFEPPPVAAA